MPITVRKKIESSNKLKDKTKSQKFTTVGEYVCKAVGFRYNPETDQYSESYYIDLEIVSGPADVGQTSYFAQYLDQSKYTTTKMADNRVFTGKQKRQKDEERIQVAFAACLGLSEDDAGELGEGGKFDGAFEAAFGDASDSTHVGKLVDVTVRSRTYSKGGETKTVLFPELHPHVERGGPNRAPKLPSPPTFNLPGGFQVHPENPAYAFNAAGDVKLVSELVG